MTVTVLVLDAQLKPEKRYDIIKKNKYERGMRNGTSNRARRNFCKGHKGAV